jgi:hypothetical protein
MGILILISFVIIIVLFIANASNAKSNRGASGELRVAGQLNKLQNDEYKVFNDVLVKTESGTSQIDHIVISIYGIFVIETKNYSGWIHGNENSEYWTQSIYEKKTKFRNPIKQNWGHIYALKEVLSDFKQVTYHPIVVFAGNAELKNVVSQIPVIYDHQLSQTVMDEKRIANLSIEQVKNIAAKLNEVNIQDKKARKEHVNQVQKHVYERKQKEESLVCPSCGGNLVVREGPYGRFYGCSNYPQCKYKLSYEVR